jgi:hypothetical protein
VPGDDDKALLVARGCNAYRIEVAAGDLLLWRSDLAHSNAQPLFAQRAHKQRFRAVAYVCMLPAARTKEPVYAKKAEGWQRRKTTTHWPNLETWFRERPRERARVAAFTASPHAAGAGSGGGGALGSSRPPPELATARQRQLHGLERYPRGPAAPAAGASGKRAGAPGKRAGAPGKRAAAGGKRAAGRGGAQQAGKRLRQQPLHAPISPATAAAAALAAAAASPGAPVAATAAPDCASGGVIGSRSFGVNGNGAGDGNGALFGLPVDLSPGPWPGLGAECSPAASSLLASPLLSPGSLASPVASSLAADPLDFGHSSALGTGGALLGAAASHSGGGGNGGDDGRGGALLEATLGAAPESFECLGLA